MLKQVIVIVLLIFILLAVVLYSNGFDNLFGKIVGETKSSIIKNGKNPGTPNDPLDISADESKRDEEYYKRTYFSVKIGAATITLLNKNDETDLNKLFGMPVSINNGVVSGDSYKDVLVKDIVYNGISINLVNWNPKEGFWINKISIDSPKYLTSQNVRIGDNKEILEKRYPGIEKSGSEEGNDLVYSYKYRDPCPLFITFQIKNGKISRINLFWEWP